VIWVLGSKGMLGTELCRLLETQGFDITATDREVDFTDTNALENYANRINSKIDWIINCAAYTAVDKAEDEKELCFALNSKGPENIAKTAEKLGAKLIHISTDYVFDGKSSVSYIEDDLVNPLSAYGRSKLEGERKIQKQVSKFFILRTAWLYGEYGNNFVHTMLKLMSKRDEVSVVSDQWGAPTWTKDLSRCITEIIKKESNSYGVFHASGEGKTNWYEFALAIQDAAYKKGILEKKISVKPLTTEEYLVKANRPKYSFLSKEKLKNEFHFTFPEWKESLYLFISEIMKG